MFIVWGKKVVYRQLGHAADFCPICREPKAFGLRRVGMANHLYYFAFSAGELLGYERSCHDCGTVLQAGAKDYAGVSKNLLPLPELMRITSPQFGQVHGERLALEAQIRRDPGSLAPELRHELIRHPFLLMSAKMDQRFSDTRLDPRQVLGLVGALLLVMFGPMLILQVLPDAKSFHLFLLFLAIGLGGNVWQARTSRPRYVGRSVMPLLEKALRPLAPTEAELGAVLAELARLKHKMVKHISIPELQARLAAR